MDDEKPSIAPVRSYLEGLQEVICSAFEAEDGGACFQRDEHEDERGLARPRVLSGGAVLERAAVNLTCTGGTELPPAASRRRPELAGRPFETASLSVIVHPRNPYAPTCHMNLRCFMAGGEGEGVRWWFGGGFDLTPFYGIKEDAVHWHRMARAACEPFGEELYPRFKSWCDEYFFLPHRNESRGIGGLFFDDLDLGSFELTHAFVQSVGDHFLPAYLPILQRRCDHEHGQRERDHQLYRRGRYVEFNLLYDRGTKYGIQSGRRIESVLASMPPEVRFEYGFVPVADSPEARLLTDFLRPRDWLEESAD